MLGLAPEKKQIASIVFKIFLGFRLILLTCTSGRMYHHGRTDGESWTTSFLSVGCIHLINPSMNIVSSRTCSSDSFRLLNFARILHVPEKR